MGLFDHAFPYITSSWLHQVLHRQIHTSVTFLLNLSFIMPYNPRSDVQCIGPRCRGTKALQLLQARRAGGCIWRWSEGHISVLRHDSSAGRSPNALFQRLSSMSLNYVRHLPQQPRVFLGAWVSPGPHLTSPEKPIMKGGVHQRYSADGVGT